MGSRWHIGAIGRAPSDTSLLKGVGKMHPQIGIQALSVLLAIESELQKLSMFLKRDGDLRSRRKLADIQRLLARALIQEQATMWSAIIDHQRSEADIKAKGTPIR